MSQAEFYQCLIVGGGNGGMYLAWHLARSGKRTDETQGFMKVLIGAEDDHILGFTMIGAEAGEIVAVVQTAMLTGAPYTVLRDAVIAHPTYAEGLGTLFSAVHDRAEE